MDVHRRVASQRLGRVLDHQSRSLDPVVGGRSIRCRSTPRKPGLPDIGLHFRHSRGSGLIVHNAYPLADQIQQHRLVAGIQLGPGKPFRLNRLTILSRPKHQIRYPVLQDCLAPLSFVERIDQSEGLIVFRT